MKDSSRQLLLISNLTKKKLMVGRNEDVDCGFQKLGDKVVTFSGAVAVAVELRWGIQINLKITWITNKFHDSQIYELDNS